MRRVLIAVVAGLTLAGCGSAERAAPEAATRPTTPTTLTTTTTVETLPAGAFDFSLPDVNGGQIEGASLQGRDLALWFWAPW